MHEVFKWIFDVAKWPTLVVAMLLAIDAWREFARARTVHEMSVPIFFIASAAFLLLLYLVLMSLAQPAP